VSEQKLFDAAMALLRVLADAEGGETAAPAESLRFPLGWLSDLGSRQAADLARLWHRLPAAARRDLMGRMDEEVREKFELDFVAVARIALTDPDPEVRLHAVRSLWECGDPRLVDRFLHLLERDPDPAVRAGAAAALGAFVERAEMEEIPAETGTRIVARLVAVTRGGDSLAVRSGAVESLGHSSDPRVRAVLETAYAAKEERLRAAALAGMGRTADPYWSAIVQEELRSPSPLLRAEAARAAGGLGLRRSVPRLIELLDDVDGNVRAGAIASLGELGGEPARAALEKLQEESSGEEWEKIEAALENAEFQESLGELPLLDVEEDGEEWEEEEESEGEDGDEDDGDDPDEDSE
jgi:HEAT repeat protein